MLGMDLINTRVAKQVVEQCLQQRVLLGWTLHSGTVIRIAPPLNIPEDILNEALEIITEVLDVVQAMDA